MVAFDGHRVEPPCQHGDTTILCYGRKMQEMTFATFRTKTVRTNPR